MNSRSFNNPLDRDSLSLSEIRQAIPELRRLLDDLISQAQAQGRMDVDRNGPLHITWVNGSPVLSIDPGGDTSCTVAWCYDTLPLLTCRLDDWQPSVATVQRLSCALTFIGVTGIAAPADTSTEQLLVIQNVGNNPLPFLNQSSDSDIGNRLQFPANQDLLLAPGCTLYLLYDPVNNCWRGDSDCTPARTAASGQGCCKLPATTPDSLGITPTGFGPGCPTGIDGVDFTLETQPFCIYDALMGNWAAEISLSGSLARLTLTNTATPCCRYVYQGTVGDCCQPYDVFLITPAVVVTTTTSTSTSTSGTTTTGTTSTTTSTTTTPGPDCCRGAPPSITVHPNCTTTTQPPFCCTVPVNTPDSLAVQTGGFGNNCGDLDLSSDGTNFKLLQEGSDCAYDSTKGACKVEAKYDGLDVTVTVQCQPPGCTYVYTGTITHCCDPYDVAFDHIQQTTTSTTTTPPPPKYCWLCQNGPIPTDGSISNHGPFYTCQADDPTGTNITFGSWGCNLGGSIIVQACKFTSGICVTEGTFSYGTAYCGQATQGAECASNSSAGGCPDFCGDVSTTTSTTSSTTTTPNPDCCCAGGDTTPCYPGTLTLAPTCPTTTSTTPPPCAGGCGWVWNEGTCSWDVSGSCGAGCACDPPQFKGTTGQCTTTPCHDGTAGQCLDYCPTSTSTTGTTLPPDCSGCDFICDPEGYHWFRTSISCDPPCLECPPPAIPCEVCGNTTHTACVQTTTPPPGASPCEGTCNFFCDFLSGTWKSVGEGCPASLDCIGDCYCPSPSGGCSACGDKTSTECSCHPFDTGTTNTSTTCAPVSSTTTTGGGGGCAGPCMYQCSSGSWGLLSSGCAGAGCACGPAPSATCANDCQTQPVGCVPVTTTTSATTTTPGTTTTSTSTTTTPGTTSTTTSTTTTPAVYHCCKWSCNLVGAGCTSADDFYSCQSGGCGEGVHFCGGGVCSGPADLGSYGSDATCGGACHG